MDTIAFVLSLQVRSLHWNVLLMMAHDNSMNTKYRSEARDLCRRTLDHDSQQQNHGENDQSLAINAYS